MACLWYGMFAIGVTVEHGLVWYVCAACLSHAHASVCLPHRSRIAHHCDAWAVGLCGTMHALMCQCLHTQPQYMYEAVAWACAGLCEATCMYASVPHCSPQQESALAMFATRVGISDVKIIFTKATAMPQPNIMAFTTIFTGATTKLQPNMMV